MEHTKGTTPGEVRSSEGLGRTLVDRLRDFLSTCESETTCEVPVPMLREAARDLALLDATVRQMKHDVHSCPPGCTIWGCVNQRLREQLGAAQVNRLEIEESLRDIVSASEMHPVHLERAFGKARRLLGKKAVFVSP